MLDSSYDDFISNTMSQIIPQIQKSDKQAINLKLEGFEITPEFKTIFIENLVIISKLTEQIVTTFSPYFFTKEVDFITLNFFIQKVYSEGLLKFIPDSTFLENDALSRLSLDNIEKIVSISSESSFKKLYKVIEKNNRFHYRSNININTNLANLILNKIFEFSMQVSIDSLQNLMHYYSDISSNKPWEYLNNFKIKLDHSIFTEKTDFKIECYPKTPLVLKTINGLESLPQEIISYYLLNANSLDIYYYAFYSTNLENKTIESIEFWEHVLSIVSISNDDSISFDRMISSFASYFQKYIKPDNVLEIYEQLIFNHFPPNQKQSNFLYNLMIQLPEQYNISFHQSDSHLSEKLLTQKRIPPPTLLKLFNLNSTIKPSTPLNTYILSFTDPQALPSDNLQIKPLDYQSNENLIKFIQQKDNYDLLTDIDEGTLSLISAALFFKNTNEAKKISGLTNENIFPFIALSRVDISDFQMSKLLLSACKSAAKNPTPLDIASIDSIVLQMCDTIANTNKMTIKESFFAMKSSLRNNKFIDNCHVINALNTLCDQFLKGEYKADQLNFILLGFKIYSLINQPHVFKTNNRKFFNMIIQNIPKIITDNKFKGILLDLLSFEDKIVAKIVSDIIDYSTSYEPIIQTMTFVTSYCKNCPLIISKDTSNINTALQKAIYENKWDDVSIVIKYMKNNHIKINKEYFSGKQIPYDIIYSAYDVSKTVNVNDLIPVILSCPNLENDTNLFNSLFYSLMKNSSIAEKYMEIRLEKITTMQIIQTDQAFMKLQDIIAQNGERHLMSVLNYFYIYSSNKKLLIRKLVTVPLKLQGINYDFLVDLIENKSYQSFICLHNIASYFPFLFEPEDYVNQHLIAVEIVLPTLNCIPSIFDDNATDETINDLKTAFAALSFLISCLHSVKFISKFVDWLFENITKLNEPQIYCLLLILRSLFNTETIKKIVLAYAVKYNFLDILTNLLDKNITKMAFKKNYDKIIFELLVNYCNLLSNIKKSGDAHFIEQIINGKNKNPFYKQFNGFHTICPIKIQPFYLNLSSSTSRIINDFVQKINQIKPFWIHNTTQSSNKNNTKAYERFLSNLSIKMKNIVGPTSSTIPNQKVPDRISIDYHDFLLTFPQWAVNFIENYYNLSSSVKYIEEIPEYRTFLNQIKQNKISFMKAKTTIMTSIDPYDKFMKNIYSQSFFKLIVQKSIQLNDLNDCKNLSDMISILKQRNDQFFDYIIQYLSEYLMDPSISSQTLAILCQILAKVWKTNKKQDERGRFLNTLVNKLVNVALSGTFHQNELLLDSICTVLQSFIIDFPKQIIHIIGLIFAYHPNLMIKAIDLYLKIGDEKCKNIIPIIQMRYKKEVDDVDLHIMRTKYLIENLPSITTSCISVTSNLLSKVIDIYKLSIDYQRQDMLDMIISLFNICAPNPNKSKPDESIQQITEDVSNNDFLYKVPDLIKKSSPIFWESFYEKNRAFLNEIVHKDINIIHKLCFLFDYEELLSFKLRYLFFKDSLKVLNHYGNYVNIKVSRSRILLDSFGYWLTNKPENFLSGFRVYFKNEDGTDQGGLTREWMTYLLKELLDPKLNLFIKSDNQSYYLNPSVELDCFKTECLKMAGGIIALSIVKNNFVNVHLSSGLLKQLLHKEISIEDVKDYDESLYNSFQLILKSEDVTKFDLFFSIDEMKNGKLTQVNLIENGDKIEVTNENKDEYVIKYIDYKLKNSVLEQTKAFCEGFDSIIKFKYIESFKPKELDMLICGNNTIDVEDMKKNIEYDGDYHLDHSVIKMFFNVISKWDQEKLSKLILFITGSPKIGINGFADYRYNHNPLTISMGGSKNRLPVSHTCSNQLDLPEYDDEKDMNDKLLMAIEEHQFGIS